MNEKVVNKGIDVPAKHKNEKMFLHLACENNHNGIISILSMVFYFLFFS
jgi:hypothetical protein